MTDEKPLRPNVGMAVFNADGRVLFCKRPKKKQLPQDFQWQMPQGGIDPGEDVIVAAYRELYEETNIQEHLVEEIETIGPFEYYYPPEVIEIHPHRKYAGQSQYWVAFKYLGTDDDIDLENCPDPSFIDWRWEDLDATHEHVIPFKTDVYLEVIAAFQKHKD